MVLSVRILWGHGEQGVSQTFVLPQYSFFCARRAWSEFQHFKVSGVTFGEVLGCKVPAWRMQCLGFRVYDRFLRGSRGASLVTRV